MSFLNILFFYLLIINSTSISIDSIFKNNNEDISKCEDVTKKTATLEKCTAVTSTFQGPNRHESKCCFLSCKIDPFENFKLMFGKNWKQQFMKMYNLNEKQAEDTINRAYGSASEGHICADLIKNYENVELYQISLPVYDGKIKYNCGDGEEVFDRTKFSPSNEEEKMNIDYFDCRNQSGENNCLNKGSKLLSDNSQCCWCEEIFIYNEEENLDASTKNCEGYRIKELRNNLEEFIEQRKGKKITKKCTCSDKNGNNLKINLNTFNGQLEITN